jgi:uncharacterized protein YueI
MTVKTMPIVNTAQLKELLELLKQAYLKGFLIEVRSNDEEKMLLGYRDSVQLNTDYYEVEIKQGYLKAIVKFNQLEDVVAYLKDGIEFGQLSYFIKSFEKFNGDIKNLSCVK